MNDLHKQLNQKPMKTLVSIFIIALLSSCSTVTETPVVTDTTKVIVDTADVVLKSDTAAIKIVIDTIIK